MDHSYKQFRDQIFHSKYARPRESLTPSEPPPPPVAHHYYDSPHPAHHETPRSRRQRREFIMGPADDFVAERLSRSDVFTPRRTYTHNRRSLDAEPGRADFFTSTPRKSLARRSHHDHDYYTSTSHRSPHRQHHRSDSRADFFTSTPHRAPHRSGSIRNISEHRRPPTSRHGQRVSLDSEDGSRQFSKGLKDYRYHESGRPMTAKDMGTAPFPRHRQSSLHRAHLQSDRPRQHQTVNVADLPREQASKVTYRTAYNAAKPLKKSDFRAGGPLPEPSCSTRPKGKGKGKPKLHVQEAVYDESGRPLTLSETDLDEGPGDGRPAEYYDTSGQPVDPFWPGNSAPREQGHSYHESEQQFDIADYARDAPPAVPAQVYDRSGHPYDIAQYLGECRRESRQPQPDRGRDKIVYDNVNRRRGTYNASEQAVCSYREAGHPPSVADHAERPQHQRAESVPRRPHDAPYEAYDAPVRPSDNIARPQPKVQSRRVQAESDSYTHSQHPAPSAQSCAMPSLASHHDSLNQFDHTAPSAHTGLASHHGSFNQFHPTAFSTHTGLVSQARSAIQVPPHAVSEYHPSSLIHFKQPAVSTQTSQIHAAASYLPAYGAQSPRPQTAPAAEYPNAQRQLSFHDSYTARRQPSRAESAGRSIHTSREDFGHAVRPHSRDDVSRITEASAEPLESPRGTGGEYVREQICAQQVPSAGEQRSHDATFHVARPRVQYHEPPHMTQYPCPERRSAGTTTQAQHKPMSPNLPPPERVPPCQTHTKECPNISQEQLVQFLQYGDLSQILAGEPLSSIPRSPLFNTLVKDNYHPGAIEDAVHGQIDFNRIAFDAVFANDAIPKTIEPEDVPMSLLEAFELRIRYEQDLRENLERRREFCLIEKKQAAADSRRTENKEEKPTSSSISSSDMSQDNLANTPYWRHRDELKLASTIDIDLTQNYRDHPETDLTQALSCLFKAEKMNVFDKFVHVAEEAIREVPITDLEKAALRSACTFHVDMQKEQGKSQKTYKPIEVISYIGTTRPK